MSFDGPVARSAYRVPRSHVDELYVRGEPLPSLSIGAAQVVSVEGETCTVLVGDETITGVVFLGDPPAVGDYVELESRADLIVIPDDTGGIPTDTFIEGISTTAAHIVSEDDPGTLPDETVHIAGSMRDLASWSFLAPDDPAWTRTLDPAGAGLHISHDHTLGTTAGTLWSSLPFDVLPGDVLHVTLASSWLSLSTLTVTPVVAWSVESEGDDPLPGVDTEVDTYPPGWLIDSAGELSLQDVTVPDTITTVTDGTVAPARARFGLLFTITTPGTGVDVDLLLAETQLVRSSKAWPIGSIWFDPDANTGGLNTLPVAPQESSTDVNLPNTTTFSRAPGFRKLVFSAPPDAGGILLLFAIGSLTSPNTNGVGVDLRLGSDMAGGDFPYMRVTIVAGSSIPISMMGSVEVTPGQSGEVWVEYRYAADPGATVSRVRLGYMLPIFLPAAVRPGITLDPMSRYWDGDSWRPPDLHGAAMDLTQLSTVISGGKTATTTTCTRTPGTCNPGDTVTLKATVTPTLADGSVAFYKGPSSTGPWTGIGSVALNASNTATKTYKPTTAGTLYFLAKFLGSTAHAQSQGATASLTVRNPLRTVTKTVGASWVQAYDGAGAQLAGSEPNPGGIHQGYFVVATGNRRSLMAFNVALPSDADVQKVELVCHGWTKWYQASEAGTIRLGWHSNSAKPTTWTVGTGATARSAHTVTEGAWRIAITSWADVIVTRSDFWGIAVGPGVTDADLYQGYSEEGADEWDLVITYTTRT